MARMKPAVVDLAVIGQPECCKNLCEDGWQFIYEKGTQFVAANHPNGGRQSVVEVCRIASRGFYVDQIGEAIAALLNGGEPDGAAKTQKVK